MPIANADFQVQSEFPLGAPEYLQLLEKFKDLDPSLVRLSVDETSLLTGLARKTLESMRVEGRGPAFLKMGRRVQYRLSDVRDFMDRSLFTSTRAAKTARAVSHG